MIRQAFTICLCLFLGVQSAHAGRVEMENRAGQNQLRLQFNENEQASIFKRFNDIWVVTNGSEPLTLALPDVEGDALEKTERLQVTNGQGVRLRFTELPTSLKLIDAGNGRYILPLEQERGQQPFVFELSQEQGGVSLPKKDITHLRRATSIETRESYLVGLTSDPEIAYPQPQIVAEVRALETLLGASLVSALGLPLEYKEQEDKFIISAISTPMSRAIAQGIYGRVGQEFVDNIFANSEGFYPAMNTEMGLGSRYGLDMSELDVDVTPSAANTMMGVQDALDAVNNLQNPLGPSRLQMARSPYGQDENVALYESILIPDYGRRSAADVSRLENLITQRIVRARTDEQRDEAILQLARLQYFLGRYPEVVGLLRTMGQDEEVALPKSMPARLLLSVGQQHLGRLTEAEGTLAQVDLPSLDKLVWEANLMSLQGEHERAIPLFRNSISVAATYPNQTEQWLRYNYAQSLYATGELNAAAEQINALSSLSGAGYILPAAQLLLGRIYEDQDSHAIAEQIYISLSNHPNQIIANKALYHFLRYLHEQGELTGEDAISRFENLRNMWRGDDVEKNSLYMLGNMYLEEGQLRSALRRFRYLNENFPLDEKAQLAAQKMTEIFEDIFIDGEQDETLDAVSNLALYFEFKELTPPGREGDKLIARIVEDLKAIGHYRRAIALLSQQLDFRIKDDDLRAAAGAQLARLHHLNRTPREGLEALADTRPAGNIPQSIQVERSLVAAELNIQLQRFDEAIAELENISNTEADYLRALAAWEKGELQKVVDFLDERFTQAGQWREADKNSFLRYVMALTQLEKSADLKQASETHKRAIEDFGLEPQMAFLHQLVGGEAVEDIDGANPWADVVGALDQYNDFAASYRERTDLAQKVDTVDEKLEAAGYPPRGADRP